MKRLVVSVVALVLVLGTARATWAQTPAEPPVPADLTKIKKVLEQPQALKIDSKQIKFYSEVVAKKPTFANFLGKFDLKNGPVPGAGMTHAEFVGMVTPKDLYSSTGITATDMLQVALTNYAGHALIRKIQQVYEAKHADEILAIRAQIDRELAALAGIR